MADLLPNPEPTFDLPTGSSSDFYLSREAMSGSDKGKIIKKKGLWTYPYLTRRTGDSLVGTNEEITSSELRHGRTRAKSKLGNASSSGSHDFEFSPETFDDELEGAFRSEWVRWTKDGEKTGIVTDHKTSTGWLYVNGENGTYNQVATADGKRVSQIPLFSVKDGNAGTVGDEHGLLQVDAKWFGTDGKRTTTNPFGKFIVHELHVGETPVKYSFTSRIPVNNDIVRYQNYKHVEVSEMNLNVTVNAIVTGSFNLTGSNNSNYYTETQETGKTRMAVKMADEKDLAIATDGASYSTDYRDAAEKFIATLKNTTKSTETDQLMATETFLTVNGHRIQFASDLTVDINNNLSSIHAIGVVNAIANISPRLDVTGNVTVYFTDGEEDANGKKFGADDLKNLASNNEDVELIFTIQDKHDDPSVIYVFQIFKSTLSTPTENKNGEDSITCDMNYTSFGEKAIRILRCAIPKIRQVKIDGASALGNTSGTITLVPNVPLNATKDSSVLDDINVELSLSDENGDNISTTITAGDRTINSDGSISLSYTTSEALTSGTLIKAIVSLNGDEVEETESVVPALLYIAQKTSDVVDVDSSINLLTSGDILYGGDVSASDVSITSSNENFTVAEDTGVVSVASSATENETAKITITSKYDSTVSTTVTLRNATTKTTVEYASTPSITTEKTVEVTSGETLTLTASATKESGETQTFVWTKGKTQVGTEATYTKNSASSDDAGTYTVKVTNSATGKTSKTASTTVTVTVN